MAERRHVAMCQHQRQRRRQLNRRRPVSRFIRQLIKVFRLAVRDRLCLPSKR